MNARLFVASVATIAVAFLAGCGATTAPTTTPAAVTSAATPTATATPVVSLTEQQDRTYFTCVAPAFSLSLSYDQAQRVAPDELARVVQKGRELYTTYAGLPLTVDQAIRAADLDEQSAEILRCAVTAFEGGAA